MSGGEGQTYKQTRAINCYQMEGSPRTGGLVLCREKDGEGNQGCTENPRIFALEGTSGSKAQPFHLVDGETEAQNGEVTWPGSLIEAVTGSQTLVPSQGSFEGTRCPFRFSVSRSLCPNSTFGKTFDISIQRSPRRCPLRPEEPGAASPSSRGSVASSWPRMGWLSFSLSLSISLAFL